MAEEVTNQQDTQLTSVGVKMLVGFTPDSRILEGMCFHDVHLGTARDMREQIATHDRLLVEATPGLISNRDITTLCQNARGMGKTVILFCKTLRCVPPNLINCASHQIFAPIHLNEDDIALCLNMDTGMFQVM